MKTIFLVRNIEPNKYGGGESYQLELARVLLHNNVRPIIVTSCNRLYENAQKAGIEVIRAPFFKRQNWSGWRNILLPIYIVKQQWLKHWYVKQIKKYQPDILDIESRDDFIAATRAGRQLKKQIFWTDHADFRIWVMQNINVKGKNFIGKWILRLANIPDKIIMISEYEKQYFEENIRKLPNLLVISNGVVDEYEQYQNQASQKTVCYLGRLSFEKGLRELIEAFDTLAEHDIILHMYGDGDDEAEVKKLAANNPHIVMHGYADQPLQKISESQYFILPSYHEGMSIALLEALMLGRTIIATRVTGNTEVIQDKYNGRLIPDHDAKAISDILLELFNDKKQSQTLAKNARATYCEKYNYEANIQTKLLPLFK